MKKVTPEEWQEKAANFQSRIAANPYPKNLDHYRKIVETVTVGDSVLDIGAGDCHLAYVLPPNREYTAIDPFPRNAVVKNMKAEDVGIYYKNEFSTVFCLAALDNVQDVRGSLLCMQKVASLNIVILTGIDVPNYPDALHTHRISRKDLTDVLGEPAQEIEISPKVFLFEFFV